MKNKTRFIRTVSVALCAALFFLCPGLSYSQVRGETADDIPYPELQITDEAGHVLELEIVRFGNCKERGSAYYWCKICAIHQTVELPVDPDCHLYITQRTVGFAAPTCGKDGYTGDSVCTNCGKTSKVGKTITATGNHTWGEYTVSKVADCVKAGEKTRVCGTCGATDTVSTGIDPNNHSPYDTYLIGALTPDCANSGYSGDTVCRGCGNTVTKGKTLPKTNGHVWDDGTVTKTPDCSDTGVKTFVCGVCGNKKTEIIDKDENKHPNSYIKTVGAIPAKCETDGYTGDKVCSKCGKVLEKGAVLTKTDHSWDVWKDAGDGLNHKKTCLNDRSHIQIEAHAYDEGTVKTSSTCAAEGKMTYTCTVCGAAKNAVLAIDPGNHSTYGTRTVGALAANCGSDGYTGDIYCKGCGELVNKGSTIPATGRHSFSEWKPVGNDGTLMRVCSVCGLTQTKTHDQTDPPQETPPAEGHRWDGGTVTKHATCNQTGLKVYKCLDCGAEKTEITPYDAANHAGHTVKIRNAAPATCEAEGYTGDRYCTGCGATLLPGQSIPATGHSYGPWKDCEDGLTHKRTCSNDRGHSETAFHRWNAGEITKIPTCTAQGRIKYTCADCQATRTEYLPVDPENHGSNEIRYKNSVAATCGSDGYSGDVYCFGCKQKISDGRIIPATGDHIWTDTDGSTRICASCGKTENKPEPTVTSPGIPPTETTDPAPSSLTEPSKTATYLIGDFDQNGIIDASDARNALRAAAKLDALTELQLRILDINEDGYVTAEDARMLLRISAKLAPAPQKTITVTL